ncbi:hypothetical protein ACSVDE_01295 [Pseudalkalibacillus sp. Hm43]|uniref:hypothetical protein n=1 Tax=Pseudalkalibacillus sp. Hm43 TaxID=3450742 RepID=UPI003F41F850
MLKKKALWIGTLGLATLGMLSPQFVGASTSGESPSVALEQKEDWKLGFHFKKHLLEDEFQALLDAGYSKKEILKASHITNASDASIEDVLQNYKETGSWKETAEHFGLDPERHMKRSIGKALHKDFNKEKFETLLEDGYTKEEIMKGIHIARAADKTVEEVLEDYKGTNSWEETMNNLGVEKEDLMKHKGKWAKGAKYLEAHKEEVVNYLSEYTGERVENLNGYLENDMRLHHLVRVAVVAHLSDSTISEVIEYKQAGHSREEFKEKFSIEKEEFHTEMKKVWTEIKSSIKE